MKNWDDQGGCILISPAHRLGVERRVSQRRDAEKAQVRHVLRSASSVAYPLTLIVLSTLFFDFNGAESQPADTSQSVDLTCTRPPNCSN